MMNRLRIIAATVLAGTAILSTEAGSASPRDPPEREIPVEVTAEKDVWLRRLVGRFRLEGMVEIVAEGYTCTPPSPEPDADPPPLPPPPFCKTITGKSDCVGIGNGPGVQCVMSAEWEDLYDVVYPKELKPGKRSEPSGAFNLPGGVSYLNPAMMLFGLDPGNDGINYLLVDNKGIPEGGLGSIVGNRATFKTTCVNAATLFNGMKPPVVPAEPPEFRTYPRTCERTIRIDAKPDANILQMSMEIEINKEMWTRYTLSMHRVERSDESILSPATK